MTGIAVWTQGVGEHEYEYEQRRVLMTAGEIDLNPKGLPDVIRQTRRLATDHDVFLTLLSGVITYSDRPLRNRYLDLISGLEAYDAQLHGVGPMALDTFKAKRKAAIDAIASAGLDSADRQFIKRWLQSRSSYSLEDRLRRLAEKVGVLPGWTVSAQRMGNLRNDVAHGNTGADPAQVHNCVRPGVRFSPSAGAARVGRRQPFQSVTTAMQRVRAERTLDHAADGWRTSAELSRRRVQDPNACASPFAAHSTISSSACWYTACVNATDACPSILDVASGDVPDFASAVATPWRRSWSRTSPRPTRSAIRPNACVNAPGLIGVPSPCSHTRSRSCHDGGVSTARPRPRRRDRAESRSWSWVLRTCLGGHRLGDPDAVRIEVDARPSDGEYLRAARAGRGSEQDRDCPGRSDRGVDERAQFGNVRDTQLGSRCRRRLRGANRVHRDELPAERLREHRRRRGADVLHGSGAFPAATTLSSTA